ncbi:30S ribosomal protein S4 [Candidatus Micrarchaeota archaeon]|nr:30S ribosomal protein S4 [Candidatus Micrarchaeota archaeon]
MGDPRRLRNKYERPKKLWDEDRITHDKTLKIEYGLKNMAELWRATAELKKYRREARRLLALTEEERKLDSVKIITKLVKRGILKQGSDINDVLSLEVRSILERRLQTIVTRKGLARTMRQSRQLITHGYVGLKGRRVTRPGIMVDLSDESHINYTRQIDISVRDEVKENQEPEKEKSPASS